MVMKRSHGVYLSGDFWLRKGEELHILVGQQGEDACPSVRLLLLYLIRQRLGTCWEPAADEMT